MSRILAAVTIRLVIAGALASSSGATLADTASGQQRFRELYKELVETNTSYSAGSCTIAAERVANRLRTAGFSNSELHVLIAPGHPTEGSLVAVYPGRDAQRKAILLLAHLDVVEAKREDWTRDPFTLVEENGNLYARGAVDDKAQGAIWVDTLTRFREEHYRPLHTLKVALTCGEEGAGTLDGAEWLAHNQRGLIDAAFALNEGARGELDADGHRVALEVQAGEKTFQNFVLEVTSPGGHSSIPVKDNAIYRLAKALQRIDSYAFPVQFTDASRAYFSGMAKIQAARGNLSLANAMNTLVQNPTDSQATELISAADAGWNATLRTTCVATMLDAGHATNALPQRARANINCRIVPGVTPESVRAKLEELVADRAVKVLQLEASSKTVPSPPLTREILAPIERLAGQFWPGVPVLPILQPGATDGEFLNAAGIPTYGIEPLFLGPDWGNIHGLNEYVGVQSLLECRDFLYRLVKSYAEQK